MSHDSSNPTYWIPSWWDWMSNWSDCATCLQYNGTPCASCEIPPGLLALAQLVGGGTATVAGSMRGNCGIANAQQAQAAATQHGSAAVASPIPPAEGQRHHGQRASGGRRHRRQPVCPIRPRETQQERRAMMIIEVFRRFCRRGSVDTDPQDECARCGGPSIRGLCSVCQTEAETHT